MRLMSSRFLNRGRYVVICVNRTDPLNDWIVGSVKVNCRERVNPGRVGSDRCLTPPVPRMSLAATRFDALVI